MNTFYQCNFSRVLQERKRMFIDRNLEINGDFYFFWGGGGQKYYLSLFQLD